MFVPFHGDGVINQFEGYEDLEELRLRMRTGRSTEISSGSTGSCARRG